jgi:hypothetical protein
LLIVVYIIGLYNYIYINIYICMDVFIYMYVYMYVFIYVCVHVPDALAYVGLVGADGESVYVRLSRGGGEVPAKDGQSGGLRAG